MKQNGRANMSIRLIMPIPSLAKNEPQCFSYTAGGNVNQIVTLIRQYDRFYRSET